MAKAETKSPAKTETVAKAPMPIPEGDGTRWGHCATRWIGCSTTSSPDFP